MPPRLPALTAHCWSGPSPAFSYVKCLSPLMQGRSVSILATLADNPGAYNKRIRRGRGPSSGKGKTSGRGHKGQKQHGKVPARFQGGQTPQNVVHGERGFKNLFSLEMTTLNLDRVQAWIDQGRIDPTKPITVKELVESRCLHRVKDGVKLLANGKEELKSPINILVSRASAAAIEAIEAAGGTITTRYFTEASIKRILNGQSEASFTPFAINPKTPEESAIITEALLAGPFRHRLPDPTSRKDLEYYRDPAHRGYLSHMVEEGQGPSLFFKTPTAGTRRRRSAAKGAGKEMAQVENKLW